MNTTSLYRNLLDLMKNIDYCDSENFKDEWMNYAGKNTFKYS